MLIVKFKPKISAERLKDRASICAVAALFVIMAGGAASESFLCPKPRPFFRVASRYSTDPEKFTALGDELSVDNGLKMLNGKTAPNDCEVQLCTVNFVPRFPLLPTTEEKCEKATEQNTATVENDLREYEKREKIISIVTLFSRLFSGVLLVAAGAFYFLSRRCALHSINENEGQT